MKNNELKQAIGSYEATYVQKFDIDLFNKKITLVIVIHENGNPETHVIVFQCVSAFYFSNGPGEHRFNVHTWDLMEISGVGYYQDPQDHITCLHDEPGTSQYDSHPNFNLEIWNATFLIEAKEVVINGVVYQAR